MSEIGTNFVAYKKNNLWVSEGCMKSNCEAVSAVGKIKEKPQEMSGFEYSSCRKLNGSVLVVNMSDGNDIEFCKFNDGSYIWTWNLVE